MSNAWETTLEDVQNVIARMGKLAPNRTADDIMSDLDINLVECSALCGMDIDEQTEYAYNEIEKQISFMA